jgi:hypothetical protein
MTLFQLTSASFSAVPTTSFAAAGVKERSDLQRLLRDQPDVFDDNLFVISEEFSDWEDSQLRIDILALSRAGRLVVIELKRDEQGGLMELQAVRYAAMVANMTWERLVSAHQRYITARSIAEDPRARLSAFLQVDESIEPVIDSAQPQLILVSAGFSKELTTTVLWLNDCGLDIRCFRLQPYVLNGATLVDVTQVIPLRGAEDYMVRARQKAVEASVVAYPLQPWTKDDIDRLAVEVKNPTVLALMDLLVKSESPLVSFAELVASTGRTVGQARGDLAYLTAFVRRTFKRNNWPVDVVSGSDGGSAYRFATAELAGWWAAARTSAVEDTGPAFSSGGANASV